MSFVDNLNFNLEMETTIRITEIKNAINLTLGKDLQFWKDIKEGDVLNLTYAIKYKTKGVPKIHVVNGNSEIITTSTILAKMISDNFKYKKL